MADPDHTSSEAEQAAEWSPAELDRLEDALERWTDEDVESVPEDSSLTPRMRERLESYRDLLTLTRAELPMEEVPDGLLAGVFAEAARGAAAPQREIKVEAARVGFWERLRRSMLLPGVALAGSAALLLWAVQPGDDAPASLELQAANTAPARLAPGPSPSPAAAQEPESPASLADTKSEARKEQPADEAFAPAAAPPPAAVQAEEIKEKGDMRSGAGGSKKAKKAEMPAPDAYLPGLEEVTSDASADKDELRDTLEQADKARRKGRCAEANKLYMAALGMAGPRDEQAQVRAGYALCLQSLGEDATATRYFEAASKLSPSIESWIRRERGDSSPKKSPAKPSSKLNVDEPFK